MEYVCSAEPFGFTFGQINTGASNSPLGNSNCLEDLLWLYFLNLQYPMTGYLACYSQPLEHT